MGTTILDKPVFSQFSTDEDLGTQIPLPVQFLQPDNIHFLRKCLTFYTDVQHTVIFSMTNILISNAHKILI